MVVVRGRSAHGALDRATGGLALVVETEVAEIHPERSCSWRRIPASTAQSACMSESGRSRAAEERLREEVVELRSEVRRLTARLDRQQDDLASSTASFEELSVRGEESRAGGSDLGGSTISTSHTEVVSTVSNSLPAARPYPNPAPAVLTWAQREEIARGIGVWLRRALEGEHRQNSGRDRVPLSSRYYLAVKDYAGNTYENPILVFSRFARVQDLCQRGSDWSDSIFIGVPSQREGQVAAAAAGLIWPAQIQ